jgi:hypothetical protein
VILMNPTCEDIQLEISSALDEGNKLPAAALDHAAHCPDCAAFLDAWTGGLHETLAGPMPPAGLVLRDEILALPAETARVESTRHRFRGYLSAAAAAVVLGIAGYTLVDIQPSGTTAAHRPSMADKELAAIKSDFRRGLAALREPAGAVQRVLNP